MSSLSKPKVCAVIPVTSIDGALTQLAVAQPLADWLELRLDYLAEPTPADLQRLLVPIQLPTIVCCRARSEGGQFAGSRAAQQQLYQQALHHPDVMVDIDWLALPELGSELDPARWVLSYHDFHVTPSISELRQLQTAMRQYQPYAMKFACHTPDAEAAQRLLQFLLEQDPTERVIVVGMGEAGKTLRVCAPLLGGWLTYAALPGASTAPGQPTLAELQAFYRAYLDLV